MAVDEALAKVLANAKPLPVEHVTLSQAAGRVLADNVGAKVTQPPADVSAMDGYAVRAADIAAAPARLKIVGEVGAGHPFSGTVGEGEAARIFTGAVVPAGADTVVVQENATRDGDFVVINVSASAGKNIRRAGLDFRRGEILLHRGRPLSARDLMLAAAMNHAALPVHRAARVAILGTGDELILPGTVQKFGQVFYSNGFALIALAQGEGATAIDLGIVPDSVEETTDAVRRAREAGADILVTCGGASVGEHDVVQKSLAVEGLELSFWKVAMRPGRPVMHGRLGGMQVLGLPGNPVSSYVCALLFLVPLIRRLQGRRDLSLATGFARVSQDLQANDERMDFLRATLDGAPGDPVATPLPVQDSSMMAALAKADCLLIREPHAAPLKAGAVCPIVKLTF